MLEGLDDIDWSSLNHAYGSADDVPDLLRALTSADAETRNEAFEQFYGNIYHQGTVYQASAYAAPFLISQLGEPAIAGKWQILALLASLAEGTSYHDVHGFWRSSEGDDATLREELDWVKRTRQAVSRGAATYLSLLAHDDEMVRQVAPFTLARCLVRDKQAAAQMMLRAREEREDLAHASLLLGIGSLAEPLDEACIEFLAGVMAAATAPIVRLAAALGLRQVGGEGMLGRVVPIVLDSAGPAMERGEKLIWFQMGQEYLPEVDRWLGGPSEARFDFFNRLIERTDGSVRASVVFALTHLCNEHPEVAPLSAPLMSGLLADEHADVRRNTLWLLDDVPAARADTLAILVEMAEQERDPKVLQWIAKVICHYRDPFLVPVLARFVRQNLGSDVIKALGALGSAAADEAPLLAQILNSPPSVSSSGIAASNARIAAALALGSIGPSVAKIAVPALIRAMVDGHATRAVPQALGKFGPLARAAEPVLLRASEQGDVYERGFAILALWQIDAWPARVAVEALTQILEASDGNDRRFVAGLLAKIGPAARKVVGTVREMAQAADIWSQIAAAVALWKIDGDSVRAIPIFTRALETGMGGAMIFECLGEMGSAARDLLPQLRAALASGPRTRIVGSDDQVVFRDAAAEAIRQIEGAS